MMMEAGIASVAAMAHHRAPTSPAWTVSQYIPTITPPEMARVTITIPTMAQALDIN
jgi:hypothetical protein